MTTIIILTVFFIVGVVLGRLAMKQFQKRR